MDKEPTGMTAEVMEKMAQMVNNPDLKLPPPIFIDMGGEFIEIDLDARMMRVRFPVLERFENPFGIMQGGVIAAAIDNAIGPLSFLVAPPSVTKTLTVNYRRPVRQGTTHIDVIATFVGQDGKDLTFEAEVIDPDGKLLVKATAHQVIVAR